MNIDQYTHKLSRLRKVASHIDSHLEQPMSLDELAGIASMSRFHFERVFASYAGETPVARVRRLRLSIARQRIEKGEVSSMLDLALDSGYSSAEAFSRAFRSCHGVAPSGLDIRPFRACPVRIVHLSGQPIQYLDFSGFLDEFITPFDQLRAHALAASIPRDRRKGWCVQLSGDMADPSREVHLHVGLLSERLGCRISGLKLEHLPEADYAVIRMIGGYSPACFDDLTERIREHTGRSVIRGAPVLRCFHNANYLPAKFEKQCDLYLPVAS